MSKYDFLKILFFEIITTNWKSLIRYHQNVADTIVCNVRRIEKSWGGDTLHFISYLMCLSAIFQYSIKKVHILSTKHPQYAYMPMIYCSIRILYINLGICIQNLIFCMVSRVKNRDNQIGIEFCVDPMTTTTAVRTWFYTRLWEDGYVCVYMTFLWILHIILQI